MRAGDVVLHRPTGERWVVAVVVGDDLAWVGWPDGIARTSDCELVEACSDTEHERTLRMVADSQGDQWRQRRAREQLATLQAEGKS